LHNSLFRVFLLLSWRRNSHHPLGQVPTSIISIRKCFMKFPKIKFTLIVSSWTWWTFLKMWGLQENYIISLSQQGTSSLGGRKEWEPMNFPPNHVGTNLWVSSPLKHFAQRSHPLKDIYIYIYERERLYSISRKHYIKIWVDHSFNFLNYAVDLQPHYMNSDQNNNDSRD
jgi:hypothetical protein